MKKIWTLLRAMWILLWTNRDLIERHLSYLEAEKNILQSTKDKEGGNV